MRKKPTCEEVLQDYIETYSEVWHKKVSLYVIADGWSPETVGRTLRTMYKEKKINKGSYDGVYANNLAKYCSLKLKKQYRTLVTEFGEEIKIEK